MFVFIRDRYGKIEFDWPDRRFPAHADPGTGLKVAAANIAYRFATIDKHRAPPFSGHVVLVLQRSGYQLRGPFQVTVGVFRGDRFVFVAANTAIAPGEETQIRRYFVEITGFNPAQRAACNKTMAIVQCADPDVLCLENGEIDI
ncbi:Uncharacterised protein [Escherichia coli]|uniref:Uncharacterized protein n=1 Tax=Escherichia coli TaxID=562 RepID=A0A376L577_ECOLX|nr:Uncharacterised protein [Escherichia coli]